MPNKKGFTLVELIATVTIMLLITIIVTPNIMNHFNKGTDEKYKLLEAQILSAAESYYLKNKDSVADNGNKIPLSSIINEIDEEFRNENDKIINPKNSGDCLGGDVIVEISGQRTKYSYTKQTISCD